MFMSVNIRNISILTNLHKLFSLSKVISQSIELSKSQKVMFARKIIENNQQVNAVHLQPAPRPARKTFEKFVLCFRV